MYRSLAHRFAFLLSLSRAFADTKHDLSAVTHFVSRPDLLAPKWDVTVYDQSRVAPGFWFVAPFEDVGQNKAGEPWVGPYIFDGEGELVWSGTKMFGYWNVFDFRISEVLGEKHMTLFTGQDGMATVLGDDYRIRDQWSMGTVNVDVNMHELNFIAGGTRALIGREYHQRANPENSKTTGWEKGECRVLNQGFREMDVKTWQPVFEWNSGDHVWLNESSYLDEGVEARCGGDWDWDYFHINSIDKSRDGDYFISSRHTDTLYKISGKDGSIIWRLGGKMSDFDMGELHFTRQHDIRYRGENETHTFLSFLDNAKGLDKNAPSAKMSRGLLVALETAAKPMVAHVQQTINHPEGLSSFAWRRGNLQRLPHADHTWVQWSEQALQSEHDADGTLIMKAKMRTQWMGTYRSYKFPFIGRPSEPIAVHSQGVAAASANGTRTLVHASWNGATEVASWNLYKTTRSGEPRVLVANMPRQGFETPLAYEGFASFVLVEALDAQGAVLGASDIFKTIAPATLDDAVAAEVLWLQAQAAEQAAALSPGAQQAMDEEAADKGADAAAAAVGKTPVGLFVGGFVVSIAAVLVMWRFHAPRRLFNFAVVPFISEKGAHAYQALMSPSTRAPSSPRDVENGGIFGSERGSGEVHGYSDK